MGAGLALSCELDELQSKPARSSMLARADEDGSKSQGVSWMGDTCSTNVHVESSLWVRKT